MRFVRIILWRLLAGVGVLWAAASITFVAMNVTGGDTAIAILGGPEALPTAEIVAQVRAEYGLDQPLPVQYARYIGRLATGDLGESYRLRVPVAGAIAEQAGATVRLALAAGALALLIAVVVASLTAGRETPARAAVSGAELVLTAMPTFVLGLLLLFLLSFQLRLLPVAGEGGAALVLPVGTLALPLAATMAQVLRQELDAILEQPFILAARTRGLGEAAVRYGHALRHALVPLVTLFGHMFGFLLGGAIITETLFARQGIGRLMADATAATDIPMVVGITLLVAASYVIVNLVVDLLTAAIDPRGATA
ncbi:ABC transporter permease [Sphingomonas sp. RHCKR7]|uniref:ABC transporter permease n=1 Tax=Sphingomonas folli TaxID=2862497 RepID=UPI001C66CDD5|nr:ABC transporter permease [Sphingomonas folli]MBW6528338.1 ABC transporter permease [Sphingomonas folli]